MNIKTPKKLIEVALPLDKIASACACAWETGENTFVVLDSAHIIPYIKEGNHNVKNGLLLRADFHKLFDAGLVSVTPEYKIKVSPRIRETWFNGKVYYRLDNQPLTVIPENRDMRPDPDYLQWHYKNVFQA